MRARPSIVCLKNEDRRTESGRPRRLPCAMAAPKIKKKGASGTKASPMPRQGAIPCLILVALVLIVVGLLLYFALARGIGG